MAEQVQSGPQQSRARRFLGAGKRTLDGEDRSERIKTGRKGTPFRAFSPTIKPEFPLFFRSPTTWCMTPRFRQISNDSKLISNHFKASSSLALSPVAARKTICLYGC